MDPSSEWVVEAYREYFDYIWTVVGRLGVPRSDIEDVVQEVFLVLHRRRDAFRRDSSVQTWLHGIALRVARRHRERAKRTRPDPPSNHELRPSPSHEGRAAGRAQLERLDRLLDTLPIEQREVFVLAEVAELSAPEIAGIMGVKLNTVYSRLRLARRRMKHALDEMKAADRNEPRRRDGAA